MRTTQQTIVPPSAGGELLHARLHLRR